MPTISGPIGINPVGSFFVEEVMKARRVASLTMLFAFAVMAITGIILFIVPHGRVAYWAGWSMLGLSKTQWGDIHTTMGLLMLLAGVTHVVFNWRSIMVYLKNRARELRVLTPEFNVAAVIAVVVVVFTLLQLPPVTWVVDLGSRIKDDAAVAYGEPPYGHAEQSTLAAFIANMRWDEQASLDALREAGYEFEGRGRTLLEVADANGTTPQAVYVAMRPVAAVSDGSSLPADAPAGLGRKSLAALSEEFGVDLNAVLEILKAEGIKASGSSTFKGLADDTGRRPRELYDIVRTGMDEELGHRRARNHETGTT
jgi:Domain of unknown function (DUF4405)